jgi:membrane associated rhomboid family serine protease
MPNNETAALKQEINLIIIIEVVLLGVLWMLWIVDGLFFHNSLKSHGVHPRSTEGLLGILFSPFLHSGLPHIVANTMGIIMLGSLVLMHDISKFFLVSGFSVIIGGLGVWLVGGTQTNHIGISGVIFGYFGYLISVGIFEKKLGTVLLSLLTVLLYGGMIWGILPVQISVSWEGHLFGFLGGILSAFVLNRRKEKSA